MDRSSRSKRHRVVYRVVHPWGGGVLKGETNSAGFDVTNPHQSSKSMTPGRGLACNKSSSNFYFCLHFSAIFSKGKIDPLVYTKQI